MAELGEVFTLVSSQTSSLTLALLLLVCVVSAFISAVTGGAGGILMFAALNVVIPLRMLVPIHGAVQLLNNLARIAYVREHIRWDQCIPFFIGCTLGSAAMTLGLANLEWQQLPLILLAGLIFYTVFKPKRLPEIRLKPRNFFWVGIATGTLGIIAGAVDPLLAAFFVRKDMSPKEIVANKSVMQAWCHALKVPAFIYLGFAFSDHLGLILLLTVAAVIGTRIGIALLNRIDSELFFNLMRAALLVAGARIVYQLFAA
ncbi:sulfite exporter TauE/SafE family protein [Microbulbifer hydrolyticus]|uniref:Probable membrane transporter protein n=1 Tax=Microbulbifer hydrolyticus TaxID=48074 RepID=A0A6P1TAG0_9GAMM|nr:sulfite exporter TauE/SafE family protein [Microbulbifer hydrolyticus]MBB5213153.1 putative membrane protein YfcA [Microbulbifer hydrolyticus]QHQ38643.1 TSUP family transporter [Microbulbifer hydrolyticus]